jgi:hypothetical protein
LAILLVVITLVVRLISPHTLFEQLGPLHLVPVLTGLMGIFTVVGAIRRKVSLRPPLFIILQWAMLAWCVMTLLLAGVGPKKIVAIKFVNDMLFCTIVALVVDRLPRFKLLLGGYLASLVFIGVMGISQIWSPRLCGEIIKGEDELMWDTRTCTSDAFCDQKPPPRSGAPPERHFRCERRGRFGIAAFLGRMRWVSVFSEPNTLAAMCALLAPFLVGWAWSFQRWRLVKWGLTAGALVVLTGIVFATGSRGSLLGLLLGVTFTLWRFLGKKVLVLGGVLAVALGLQLALSDKGLIRRGDESDLTGAAESTKWRTAAMEMGFRLWKQYPLFGVGHNEIFRYHYIEAHNGYISAASEIGTPGLFLYVFILWLNFRYVIAALKEAGRRGLKELHRLATGALGGLIGGTLAFTVFLTNYASFFTLTLSLLSGGLYRAVQKEDPELKLKVSYWDSIGAATAGALIIGVTYLVLNIYFTVDGFPFEFDTSTRINMPE